MRTVRGLIAAACIVASTSFWSLPARAVENDSFGATPQPETVDGVHRQSFEIPLETGATYEDAIRVYNRTDQPLDLSLYAADAQGGADSSITVSPREVAPKGVGAWIQLARDKVSLPPHEEATVTFTVKVRSADPSPPLGAIVIENTATGLAASLAEKLPPLVVRTSPPNTPTTAKRVRPLLFRTPWAIIAIIGLVVVIALVIIGWRRSRRSKDAVVPPGEVEKDEEKAETVASLPVIRRLGTPLDDDLDVDDDDVGRPLLDDDLLVEVDDDLVFDDDEAIFEDEDDEAEISAELPPARSRAKARTPPKAKTKTTERNAARKPGAKRKPPAKRKPAAKRKPSVPRARSARDRNYIPLEDL